MSTQSSQESLASLARTKLACVLGEAQGNRVFSETLSAMQLAELETAVRLRLGLVVVVYDDAGYGAEFHHFTDADHGTVRFPDVDLAAIARGYGCDAAVVRSTADLEIVGEWLTGPRDRPLLLDAKVTSEEPSWWLAEAFTGH